MENLNNILVGKRIKSRRKELQLSQEELSFRVGISKNGISQYETGKNGMSIDTAVKMANVLNTSVDYLLGREDASNDARLDELIDIYCNLFAK